MDALKRTPKRRRKNNIKCLLRRRVWIHPAGSTAGRSAKEIPYAELGSALQAAIPLRSFVPGEQFLPACIFSSNVAREARPASKCRGCAAQKLECLNEKSVQLWSPSLASARVPIPHMAMTIGATMSARNSATTPRLRNEIC